MSCITKGNTRCTKCCEAIHTDKKQYLDMLKGKTKVIDQDKVFGKQGVWQPISARRAKKINPYVFHKDPDIGNRMQFFTCNALRKGHGCTIRDTDKHPEVCKIYTGGNDYSPTCDEDINIIARST